VAVRRDLSELREDNFSFLIATLEPIQELVESDESVVIPWWALIHWGRSPTMWIPEHRAAADRQTPARADFAILRVGAKKLDSRPNKETDQERWELRAKVGDGMKG
jgi:hypothetical protein